ncbi:hypothetical protein [Amycolatopsis minnesotensis]|uniref:Uncharacterized protein n=1 Tax=Amycolatopsis minnesotensis TaxID=337894 RepID=A0ABN2PYP1_9PSEU
MTNYAAFYVGRDADAEWLGTVRGFESAELDAIPGPHLLNVTTETDYRAVVATLLTLWEQWIDHTYVPTDTPDPNDYGDLADTSYAFDNDRV